MADHLELERGTRTELPTQMGGTFRSEGELLDPLADPNKCLVMEEDLNLMSSLMMEFAML